MEPYALDAANSEDRQSVVVLQAAELALDGGTATVEPAPLVALARQARLADAAVPPKRNDGGNVTLGALGVDASVVVADIESASGVEQWR